MSWIRRDWTAEDADNWTKEDWIAIVLSPLAYFLIGVGMMLSCMNLPSGYLTLAAGVAVTVILFWVIHPKLAAVSESYEQKQREYLEHLDKIERWQHD